MKNSCGIYRIVLLVVWICFISMPSTAVPLAAPADSTVTLQRYPFIRFIGDRDSMAVSDELFLDAAARIIFPVNKYELPTDDSLLVELAGRVIPQLNHDSLQVLRVLLRGAASPEGPYWNNKRLGERRAKVLLDFLNAHLDQPIDGDVLSAENEIEDYRSLVLLMRRADDADYERVARLAETYLPIGRYDLMKKRLMQLDQGRLWRRLLQEYFPQLRAARFILLVKQQQIVPPPVDLVALTAQTGSVVVPPERYVPDVPDLPVVQPQLRVPRRELLSVKTNLLLDFAYMPGYNRWCPIPNVAIEYYPLHGHFTFGASMDFPWWKHYDQHKFFEVRNYQLEARYYLRDGGATGTTGATKGAAFRGFYLQGYAHAGLYEIGFSADKGWKGEGVGAGVGAGYVLPLTKSGHWRLEFNVQAGWFGTRYDPFQYENPVNPNYRDHLYYYKWTRPASEFKERQYRFNWVGPTRVGITLSYDLLYRRIAKKGVSFRATETIGGAGATKAERRGEP